MVISSEVFSNSILLCYFTSIIINICGTLDDFPGWFEYVDDKNKFIIENCLSLERKVLIKEKIVKSSIKEINICKTNWEILLTINDYWLKIKKHFNKNKIGNKVLKEITEFY
jgi:hypothetical protein